MTRRPAALTAGAEPLTITRSRRKTISLIVDRDGSLQIRAPLRTPQRVIDALVQEKAGWIADKQRLAAEYAARHPPKCYVTGEPHLYLGRGYPLALKRGERERVVLADGELSITTSTQDDSERVRLLLRRWYRRQANSVLAERFDAHLPLAETLGVAVPHLKLRDMRRSWGNCRQSGRITLNRDLIRAPLACIDAVIAHEFCHLRHADHSKAFYALLSAVRPDWRDRQRELDEMLA